MEESQSIPQFDLLGIPEKVLYKRVRVQSILGGKKLPARSEENRLALKVNYIPLVA